MKDLLIVEDDPTLGEGIRLALQAPELRPQLCRSLADAGELLSRRSFDLLILDINLPDGNGLDLLRACLLYTSRCVEETGHSTQDAAALEASTARKCPMLFSTSGPSRPSTSAPPRTSTMHQGCRT